MRRSFILLIFLLGVLPVFSQAGSDSMLEQLDRVVSERKLYEAHRLGALEEIKSVLSDQMPPSDRYQVYSRLYDSYRDFQTDSALAYAQRKLAIATQLRDDTRDARLNMAEILAIKGLYKESLDITSGISSRDLDRVLLGYYYHIRCRIYKYMTDISATEPMKRENQRLYHLYCDSLSHAIMPGDNNYIFAISNLLIASGEYTKARELLFEHYSKQPTASREFPIYSYLIAVVDEKLGNAGSEERYLAATMISDMKLGTKEHIALRRLAYILYRKGDLDRAYNYMKVAMDDATFCNSNMRMMEVSQILSVIDNEYQLKEKKQKEQLRTSLWLISSLSLLLLVGMILIYTQILRIRAARRELDIANHRLLKYNTELEELNAGMRNINLDLTESNCIKETYIVRYMDLCSEYIDDTENYLNKLMAMTIKGDIATLKNTLNPAQYTNDSLQQFYHNFDVTFLHLFPSFIEDFNRLLKEEHRIKFKEGELLNTELRVYALIRLGITDSVKISRFLRYSLSTIYNYRTQGRNKSHYPKKEFESRVMEIGLDLHFKPNDTVK